MLTCASRSTGLLRIRIYLLVLTAACSGAFSHAVPVTHLRLAFGGFSPAMQRELPHSQAAQSGAQLPSGLDCFNSSTSGFARPKPFS